MDVFTLMFRVSINSGEYQGALYRGTQRSREISGSRETTMGQTHGSPSPENIGPLSKLSPGHPIRTPAKTTAITLMNEETRQYWKAVCIERRTYSLEEGSRSSTTAMRQLVGFLSYAETLFSIQMRLVDFAFAKARTWPEIQQAHRMWWVNYNIEKHYAHRERQDGRQVPQRYCAEYWAGPSLKRCSHVRCTRHIHSPDRSSWLHQVQALAFVWRAGPGRGRCLRVGL